MDPSDFNTEQRKAPLEFVENINVGARRKLNSSMLFLKLTYCRICRRAFHGL